MRGQIAILKFYGRSREAGVLRQHKKLRKVYSTQEQQCKKHTYVSIGSPIFVNVTKSALKNIYIYLWPLLFTRKIHLCQKLFNLWKFAVCIARVVHTFQASQSKKQFNDHCFNCSDTQVEWKKNAKSEFPSCVGQKSECFQWLVCSQKVKTARGGSYVPCGCMHYVAIVKLRASKSKVNISLSIK